MAELATGTESAARDPEYSRRHACLVVEDIDSAMRELAAVGLEFRRPVDVGFRIRGVDGDEFGQTLRVVFSRDGSTELIQAVTPGPFTEGIAPGPHHLGATPTDFEGAIAALVAAGAEVQWRLYYEGVPVAVFFQPTGPVRARLEIVNVAAAGVVPLDR